MEMTTQAAVAKIFSAVRYATTHAVIDQAEKEQFDNALDVATAALRWLEAEVQNDPLTDADLLRMDGCAVWISGMNAWAEVSHDDRLVLTCVDSGMQIRGFEKLLLTIPVYRRKKV